MPTDASNRCRSWRRVGIAHGRTATLCAPRVYGPDRDYPVRAQAGDVAGAGMQDVSSGSRRTQRYRDDPGLSVSGLSQSSQSIGTVILKRVAVAVWGVCRERKGELIGTLCEAWEPGRTKCCECFARD
jgi:hypothetical protein